MGLPAHPRIADSFSSTYMLWSPQYLAKEVIGTSCQRNMHKRNYASVRANGKVHVQRADLSSYYQSFSRTGTRSTMRRHHPASATSTRPRRKRNYAYNGPRYFTDQVNGGGVYGPRHPSAAAKQGGG